MSGRYEPRPTRSTGVSTVAGWSLKRYEITLDGIAVPAETIRAADAALASSLPPAPSTPAVGFVIVHVGTEQVWLLVALWFDDVLHHRTFFAPLDEPTDVAPVEVGGPTACVWELAVHGHERSAYIRHVLDPADGPRHDDYLADAISGDDL